MTNNFARYFGYKSLRVYYESIPSPTSPSKETLIPSQCMQVEINMETRTT